MTRFKWVLTSIWLLLALLGPVSAYAGEPDVELSTFAASYTGDHVEVTWETTSSSSALGFNLYRGSNTQAPGTPLNDKTIPPQLNSAGQGARYIYEDFTVERGVTYYYWLESQGAAGAATLHGPVGILSETPTALTLTDMNSQPAAADPLILITVALLGTAGATLAIQRKRLAC